MVNHKKLRQWIQETYPMMHFVEEDLAELDFYDMEKFAIWLENEIRNPTPYLTLTIDVVLPKAFFPLDEEERAWWMTNVLNNRNLSLFSDEIGDTVGRVNNVSNIKWSDDNDESK